MVRLVLLLLMLLAGPAAAQDSLRIELPQGRPIVGEMIRITLRGEYTGFIALEEMKFPDSQAYDWMQLAPDDWRQERVNGLPRQVFERRIAVFPRLPGDLVIGPVTHHLTKAEGASRTALEVTAPAVSVAVAPFPAPGLPLAARNLRVTDELSDDPARIRDSQTIRRRITITAEGTMAHFLPPRPDIREKWLISFTSPEIRETRLTEKGPLAFVQWEWSLRPITGEQGTLPPLRFSWFDLAKRELRGAITQPILFGYGYLGANTGGAARLPTAALAGGALAAGLFAAALWALRGRGLRWPLWRRWLPNPHARALRRAAAEGDLLALRRVARDYADHARRHGREVNPAPLQNLDRAIFSPGGGGLDRDRFLHEMRRPVPKPGPG